MDEPTPADVVHAALDALLQVAAKSADDLRSFHDTVARAPRASLPPFPRSSVVLAERVIDDLTKVDLDLRRILAALGLPESPGRDHRG